MPRYMLFLHEDVGQFASRSRDEMMAVIKEYSAWSARLGAEGKIAGGEKLTDDVGKVLRTKKGKPVLSDGPYSEAKEYIGGFFIVTAPDYAAAAAIAETCPHLKFGGRIEIREVHDL